MSLTYQIWLKQWTTSAGTLDVIDLTSAIVIEDTLITPVINFNVNEYYYLDFGTYNGHFKYISLDTSFATNRYTFAWNHMPLDFGSPVTVDAYLPSYNKTTVTGVKMSSGVKVEEKLDVDDYFVSIKTALTDNVTFTGDAYTLILDNYCSIPDFILFIRKKCSSGWKEFQLKFKIVDLVFDTQICAITGKDDTNPLDLNGLLETPVDIIKTDSTFYSLKRSVFTTLNATLLNNYHVAFKRLLWVNTIIDEMIAELKMPVAGFRSVLLNINNPADYTYTEVDTYTDYGNYYYLMIASLSDMVKPSASNKAARLEITLKNLLSNLCKMYNGLYFVDDDNYLRLEHWEYFENVGVRVFETEDFNVKQYEQKDDVLPSAIKYTYKFNFPYQDPFATPGNPSYAHGTGTIDYNKHYVADGKKNGENILLFDRTKTISDGTRLTAGKTRRVITPGGFRTIRGEPILKEVFKTVQDPIILKDNSEEIVIDNCGTDGLALCLFASPTITTYTDNVWKGEKGDYFLCVIKATANTGPDVGDPSVSLNEYHNDYLGWDYLLPQYHRHQQPYATAWYPPDSDLVSTASVTPVPLNPLTMIAPYYTLTTQEYSINQILLPKSLAPDAMYATRVTNCCPPDLNVMDYILTDKGRARVTKILTDIYTGDADVETELRIC